MKSGYVLASKTLTVRMLRVPDCCRFLILISLQSVSALNLKHWLLLIKPCSVNDYFQNAPVDLHHVLSGPPVVREPQFWEPLSGLIHIIYNS